MDNILIKLIDFMTDPNSWRACLTGFIAGSALGYMTGMWFSKYRAERLRILSEERDKQYQREKEERLEAEKRTKAEAEEDRKKALKEAHKETQKNFEQALESGLSLSGDGRFILDRDGTRLCKPCIMAGRKVSVIAVGDGTYRCPFCQKECYVPVMEEFL